MNQDSVTHCLVLLRGHSILYHHALVEKEMPVSLKNCPWKAVKVTTVIKLLPLNAHLFTTPYDRMGNAYKA